MDAQAKHIKRTIRETVEVKRTSTLVDSYRVAIRLSLLMGTVPAIFVLFLCVLHIPFLPVVGLFVVLWMLNKVSDYLTEIALRWIWPLHSRLLMYQNPERSDIVRNRVVSFERRPVSVNINSSEGIFELGDDSLDLMRRFSMTLERSEGKNLHLRIRFTQDDNPPILVATALEEAQCSCWREEVSQLERREGADAVYQLPFETFRALTESLHISCQANGIAWPHLLSHVLSWHDDDPHQVKLTARKPRVRKLHVPKNEVVQAQIVTFNK